MTAVYRGFYCKCVKLECHKTPFILILLFVTLSKTSFLLDKHNPWKVGMNQNIQQRLSNYNTL